MKEMTTFQQAFALFTRELHVRYRRAALSILWVLIPTVAASVGAVWAGRSLGLEASHVPEYPAVVFLGSMLAQLFVDAYSSSSQLSLRCRQFIRFVPYNHTAILYAGMLFSVLNFAIKSPILIGMLIFFHKFGTFSSFSLFLLGVLVLLLLGISLSAFIIPISYVYWDVRYGQNYVLAFVLSSTPILYPHAERGILALVNRYNPFTALILGPRDWLMYGSSEYLLVFLMIVPFVLAFHIFSLWYFRRAMPLGIPQI